jgi:hypothetical protein
VHLVAIARQIFLGTDIPGLAAQFLDRLDLLVAQFGGVHQSQQEGIEHVLAPWSVAGIALCPISLGFSRSKVTLRVDSLWFTSDMLPVVVGVSTKSSQEKTF